MSEAEAPSGKAGSRVAVLIAAYNEGDKVFDTVTAVRGAFQEFTGPVSLAEVAVVNDGSGDDTSDKARHAGAVVLDLPKNRGKGSALNELIKARYLVGPPDIFLLIDADLGTSASETTAVLRPVLEGDADLAIAVFPRPDVKGGFGLVKGLARRGIVRRTGFLSSEPLSGQRALTSEVLRAAYPLASGFGIEVKMTLDALEKGFRVLEVPVQFTHRHSTRSLAGFKHRGRQFFHVLKVLLLRVA